MPPKYSREIEQPVVMGDALKEQFRTSPCEDACPAGNPIQKMQSLIEQGEFTEALRYLRAKNPFPGVTGRVCPHFCQNECNRSRLEGCVNVRALERAAGDYAVCGAGMFTRRPATGKTIAVIGGGPAGLGAAYFLALLGHDVTVYEANPVLGGVPRHAVPDFRLPRHVVDREVGMILAMGVKARLNTKVGRDISFAELKSGSDAVIIATGMPLENSLPVPGAEHALRAVEFLRSAALGLRPEVGGNVAIMGGGGVAFDCAFTAKRLGAKNVHVICLEKEGAMRAPDEDLQQARLENIQVHAGCTMSAVRCDEGRVKGVDYFAVAESSFDEKGRLSLLPVPGGARSLECDTVILAVGQKTDFGFLSAGRRPSLTPRDWIVTDAEQKSSVEGLFAAGEAALGPSSVAASIGSGRRAAFGVHRYLTGESSGVYVINEAGMIEARPEMAGSSAPYVVPFEEIYGMDQYEAAAPQAQAVNNKLNFEEINAGYTAAQASSEAARCLHCGHCKSCGVCVDDCPGYVLALKELETGERPEVAFGEECWHCANCRTSCPCGAIGFAFPLHMRV